MRSVIDGQLWVGHAGDRYDLRTIAEPEELAIVDLAMNEPPHPVFRDRLYLRIPLIDGQGNPPGRLRFAVDTVVRLMQDQVPTLVVCSCGLSRSPAIVALAIAVSRGIRADEALSIVTRTTGGDVAPGFWNDLRRSLITEQTPDYDPKE